MPPTKKVNNVWANNAPMGATEMVELPSGQVVEARRIGIEGLMAAGILAEADSLTALVVSGPVETGKKRMAGHQAKDKPEPTENELGKVLMDNPDALASVLTLADKAIPHICVNPPVHIHYTNAGKPNQRVLTDTERSQIRKDTPGVVFVDQIDMMDKMELFTWACGNLAGLSAFRGTTDATVDGMAAESGVSRPAKRPSRTRR